MNVNGTFDVAEVAVLAFTLFFIALIFYLRREDRREGYPLEDEVTGRIDTEAGPLLSAGSKTFKLPHGGGIATTPTKGREPVDIKATRAFRSIGAPYVPTGDPLIDGIGPAAWAERANVPDLDAEGHNRIVPIGAMGWTTHAKDPDPRGMAVIGADGLSAGTVTDLWVDRSEHVIRYLEVDTGVAKVLAPMTMAVVKGKLGRVMIDALDAAKFAAAPKPANPGQITRNEEERVVAYFGGGYLYNSARRQEPIL